MVISLAITFTVGGVLMFRPLVKRLADFLDALSEERRNKSLTPPEDTARVVAALESIEKRLERLEDRQSFTDQLLARGPERPRIEPGGPS